MRTAKILGVVAGGLIALPAIVLLSVRLLVNPNDFKPRIAAAAKQATGRDLMLEGDIKLAVFPWIALEVGPASLGNPPGFGVQPFVSFQHASVRARLLPLLSRRLEVGRVELDGLDVKLLRNDAGKGNWEGFGRAADERKTMAGQPDQGRGGDALQSIAGIRINEARLTYENYTIEHLNLESGSFVDKGVVPITLHVEASRGVLGEHGSADAHFDLRADAAADRYGIAALNFNTVMTLAGNDQTLRWSVSVPALDLDLAAQTLDAAAFTLNAAGAQVSGSLKGTRIADAVNLSGSVTLAPLVLREYLPRLGLTVPKTRDAKALSLVSASARFEYDGKAASLDHLQATLDDTHLRGEAAVNLATDAVNFDLAVDGIDADRYLAPPGAPIVPAPVPTATPATADAASKPVTATGTLAVGALHFQPLDLANLKVTVASKDGVSRIFPLQADLDGGTYSGDITLDQRGGTPLLSMDEHLSGVDVAKLLASQSNNLKMSGRGTVNLKATGRGATVDGITKSLNGHFDALITDGAVEGVDLGYQLGRAEALIRRQDAPNTANTRRTKFDACKMSAEIVNGVAGTRDLIISSAVLKVTGQGSANLGTKTLDFSLLADTLRTAGNVPIQIPVKISGSMADPTVRPDIEALLKGQLKQKVQEVLQDKLKGLFGKP